MRLTVLVDNNTLIDRYFSGEPGVSYYIEEGNKKILFDVGYSDIFIRNAVKMNIDLLDIDYIVLSHGHLDHTWGLSSLIKFYAEKAFENVKYKKPCIIAHPYAFLPKTVNDNLQIGTLISEDILKRHFDVLLKEEPFNITDNLFYLGEIERKSDFEGKEPIGKMEKNDALEDDYLLDDTALAYKSSEGLAIITGCSHSGICNIIEYAQKVCGDDRILDIIGGFHLLSPSKEQLKGTVEYLKDIKPKRVHACHCTDFNSKVEIGKVVKLEEVGVGLVLEYR